MGYTRASTCDQNLNRQIDALSAVGCNSIFADKEPGKNSERRELRRLFDAARPGDILVVASLGRLSRSVQDLIPLVVGLRDRGIGFKTLHEGLDTTAPDGRLIFDVFAALAECSASSSSKAPTRASPPPGPAAGSVAEKITAARALLAETSIAAIARHIGVSRGTLYAHMDAIVAGRRRSNCNA
jgi:DNA invertase Pin-like site-specific DNA recombinase